MSTKLLKPMEPRGQAEYSLDPPGSLWQTGAGIVISAGLIVKLPGWWRLVGLASLGGWVYRLSKLLYAARFGLFGRRNELLEAAGTKPYANVLDLGAGRGLVVIGAARRWQQSRFVAVDDWKPARHSSEENLRSNLDLEELGGRVHVFELAASQLPFEAASFDLILSDRYLHTLPSLAARKALLAEATRVLKPGGRLIIRDTKYLKTYYAQLKENGLTVSKVNSQTAFSQKASWLALLIADKPVL